MSLFELEKTTLIKQAHNRSIRRLLYGDARRRRTSEQVEVHMRISRLRIKETVKQLYMAVSGCLRYKSSGYKHM